MTIAELLAHEVRDVDGDVLGSVHDVRAVDDDGTLTIHELVVGGGAVAYRLGYASGHVTGPWLLTRLARLLRHDLHVVPWEHVRQAADGTLHLDVPVADLERLEERA